MTPAEILDRAADLIDTRGHCEHALRRAGAMCALGAIGMAADHNPLSMTAETCAATQAFFRWLGGDIPAWNDRPERTKDEVTSALRANAATLRAQANQELVRETETA